MGNVLIAAGSQKGRELLCGLLRDCAFDRPTFVANGGEARRMLLENEYELVVINTPLPDEFGHELAMSAFQTTAAGILLVVKMEMADEVAEKVEDFGVLVVPRPLSRQLFYRSVKLAAVSHKRMAGLQNENQLLQRKIEEIRLVDRAKCALIQYLNFTENEAHKYIEKQAMDQRCARRDIAVSILKTYEG